MNLDWPEIIKTLLENADEINVFTYRLSDGSYIMAEENSYNTENYSVCIDLPLGLNKDNKGNYVLNRWMFQNEVKFEHGTTTEPIEILIDDIIARSEAPLSLKEMFIRYNFFDKLANTLDVEEFESVIDELSSNELDTLNKDNDTPADSDPNTLLDMYNKRLQYPDWN